MDASGNVSSIPSHCLCLWCVSFELETMPFRFQHPLGRTGRSCRRNPRILPALHARGGWRSHRREARRQRGRSDCQQITWVGFRYGNRTGDHMRAICIGIMVTFSCYGDAVVQHVVDYTHRHSDRNTSYEKRRSHAKSKLDIAGEAFNHVASAAYVVESAKSGLILFAGDERWRWACRNR